MLFRSIVALGTAAQAAPEFAPGDQLLTQAPAPKTGTAQSSTATARGSAARGKSLAQERCANCHRLAAGAATEPEGAPLGPDFTSVKRVTATTLKRRFTTNHPTMPKFPNMTNQQIADLVSYINSVRK